MADFSDSDDEPIVRHQFKVVLLGDGAVGKTSLASRFANDSFAMTYKQTVGVDFFLKHIELPGGVEVALQVWDIGGQSIGSPMTAKYIFGADAVCFVYDITCYDSFADLEDWLRLLTKVYPRGAANRPSLQLMANKTDLGYLRKVKPAAHNAFADANRMAGHQLSAKTGDRVAGAFQRIAAALAGVALDKPAVDRAAVVVTAALPDHQQHDPAVSAPDHRGQREAAKAGGGKRGGCCVQ